MLEVICHTKSLSLNDLNGWRDIETLYYINKHWLITFLKFSRLVLFKLAALNQKKHKKSEFDC
jgi:hypothetical protein